MKFAACIAVAVGLASASPAAAATLVIPALHLRAQVGTSLDYGPAWWPGTRRAIAGHRTTRTHPFRHLDALVRGDAIYLDGVEYDVTHTRVVPSARVLAFPLSGRLMLSTCTPPGSAAYRIVVYAVRAYSGWTLAP